jgi:hypothetical protein
LLGLTEEEALAIMAKSNGLAEGLLCHLGASNVESLDYSEYEGASIIHDLNTDIPGGWFNKYDLVLDSGTLEHVFNYPMALWSCMRMVATGGNFVSITPTNNLCNHGFYQISPEVFFRALGNENGFRLIDCSLRVGENESRSLLDNYGLRTEIPTDEPSYLFVIAKKVANLMMFTSPPQQSDYIAQWRYSQK